MKPITILSYRRDVAPASDDVLDEALPGDAYRAADLRRIAARTETRLFRFLKKQGMPGMRAVVLSAGDGERAQALVEIRRTEHSWVLDAARAYPIALAQREQTRLVCSTRHYEPVLPLPSYLRRAGVFRPDERLDMTAPPPRVKGQRPDSKQDLAVLQAFAL